MQKFKYYPQQPKHGQIFAAYMILTGAHWASSAFLDIFEGSREARDAKGVSNEEEQDLLRAMLIFAASGLDSTVKRLVRDALASVIDNDDEAECRLVDYLEKKLASGGRSEPMNVRLLTSALVAPAPREILVEELIRELTAGSLQSKNELFKVASFFNIPSQEVAQNPELLKKIFEARNQIAHEMDVDFSQWKTSTFRRPRSKKTMISYTTELFRIGEVFLSEVDARILTA